MNVIVYKSETGFTEKYARWIAEELDCKLFCWKDRRKACLEEYDGVIFGGRFHAGSIDGLKWFKKQLPRVAGKKIAVFATGAMPATSPDVAKALAQNIPEEQQKTVPAFYMPGGLCYEKMGGLDRLMMSIFRKMLEKTQGNGETLNAIQKSYDFSAKEYILPLVEAMR